jgi:hypothetical protein
MLLSRGCSSLRAAGLLMKTFIKIFSLIFQKNCGRAVSLQPLWMSHPLLLKMFEVNCRSLTTDGYLVKILTGYP